MAGLFARPASQKRSHTAWRPRLERLEDRMLLAGEPRFMTPLAGSAYEDWAIVNYTDRDPAEEIENRPLTNIRDYVGNWGIDAYTYDGHNGLDITLPNFAAQDVGVPVYAAADGVVADTGDGRPDRHTTCDGGAGNYVGIDHGGGWMTWYYHLRTNSVAVAPGQQVSAGHVVGLVGSSGCSTAPHLHFEVWRNAAPPAQPGGPWSKEVVETYEAPSTYWHEPLPHYTPDHPGALDFGTTDHDPGQLTIDLAAGQLDVAQEWRDRPAEREVFAHVTPPAFQEPPPPPRVYAWANVYGLDGGDNYDFRWYLGDVRVDSPASVSVVPFDLHHWWLVENRDLPYENPLTGADDTLDWHVKLFINGNEVAPTQDFRLTKSGSDLAGAFQFNSPAYHVTENGVEARITVTRTSGQGGASVMVQTSDVTAVAGADYGTVSRRLDFGDGQLSATLGVPIIDNAFGEWAETVALQLSSPSGGTLGPQSSATLTIHDAVTLGPRGFFEACDGCNDKQLHVKGRDFDHSGIDDDIFIDVDRPDPSFYDQLVVRHTLGPESPGSGPNETFVYKYPIAQIERIFVETLAGNDRVDAHAYRFASSGRLTIDGGQHDDEIRHGRPLYAARSSQARLLGGNGDDTIYPGENSLVNLPGDVLVDGGGGSDTLIANDRDGTEVSAHSHTLTDQRWTTESIYFDPFFGPRAIINPIDYTSVESLTLNAQDTAPNIIHVHSTPPGAVTRIHGGGGGDQIEIRWGAFGPLPLGGYYHRVHNLHVFGDDGTDRLSFLERNDAHSSTFTVTSGSVAARGGFELIPRMVFFDETVEQLHLLGGPSDDSYTVETTPLNRTTTIRGGGGNDSVQVGLGDLDLLRSRVTIQGEDGTDSVTVKDDQFSFADTYTITNNTISRPLFAGDAADGLTYETIESLTLNAQHGDNTFLINSTPVAPVSINGGMGADTFRFADGGGLAGRIDGQDGSDTLDYLAYRTAAEVNRVAGTATGIGGGFANIENVLGATIVSAFDVLDRKLATGQVTSVTDAEALLGYPSGDSRIASESFAGLGVIDFIDPEDAGSFGHFAVNNPFPNNTPADDEDFAVKVTAVVQFPTGGFWTFGTHSDDGVRLRIDGSIVIDDPLPHAPEDRFAIYFATAGYHTLELAFFERGGGATLELFSAPGFHNTFNGNFRLVGDVANGGLNVFATTGFSVRDVKKTVPAVNDLTDADALLALRPGDPGIASERSANLPTIDFFDTEGGGGAGHYNLNRPFPNNSPVADDHFAVRADAFIYIPATSDWTFATNSDDGVRLRIDGNTVLDEPLPQGPTDHLRVVELTRGFHALNLTYFEQGGGAELELFAAQHINTAFSSSFRLVGDTVNGGLLALAASNCLTVTNTLDGGPGSLRDAIACANILPGHDTISFAIPGAGVHTIRPTSPLPAIADVTTIDGYSQPGSRPNSLSDGTDAILTIELDGTNAGPDTNGLTLAASDSAVRGLVVNRFTRNGIEVQSGHRNLIQGNYIGSDPTGTLDLGHGASGVVITAGFLSAADHNTIGGLSPADRNLISGNNQSGVAIRGALPFAGSTATATANIVQGNYIGTDATGRFALANSGHGIDLDLASGAVIGSGLLAGRNVISGNAGDGIRINGGSGPLAQPVGQWRGDGNPFDSVGFNSGTLLGGATYAPGQFNQAFNLDGVDDVVEIPDSPSHTTPALTLEAWVRPDTLGTHHSIASKYDSRFSEGISWSLQMTPDGKVEFVVVQSYIANGPIVLRGIRTVEAVLTPGTWRHVVATFDVATQRMEIYIDGASSAATLLPGSQSLASIADSPTPMRLGAIFASGGFVGLTQFWDGLLDEVALYNRALSASEVQALYRRNVGAHSITANFIGTDATGTAPLGNAGDGISITDSTGNMIGGMLPLFANTIAFNGGVGVVVESGAGNAILTNRVYSNAVLGIDLANPGAAGMVTLNDPMDADGGANTLQNFPELQSAVIRPNRLDVSGVMRGRASQPYTLQFFASATCDPSGHGQGAVMVGSVDVTTSGAGSVDFVASLPTFGPVARFITATATDAVGNTSEFSMCTIAVPEVPGDINADGTVDLYDVMFQQGRLGQATTAGVFGGDLDGDGLVSRSDVARLIQSYGASAPSPSPAAAPGAVVRHLNNAATDAAIVSMTDRESSVSRVLRSRRHSRPVLNARAPETGLASARTVLAAERTSYPRAQRAS